MPAALLLLAAGCGAEGKTRSFSTTSPDLIARHDEAMGLMGKFDYEKAEPIFAELVKAHPSWLEAKVNWAVALLNKDREDQGGLARPLEVLAEVLAADPGHLRAHYLTGILHVKRGDSERALPHFRHVAELDGTDAFAAHFTGQCLADLDRPEEALTWFRKAAALDPYLNSANYSEFQVLQTLGRDAEAAAALETCRRMKGNPLEVLAQVNRYTRMGAKGFALSLDVGNPPALSIGGSAFAESRPLPIVGADRVRWATFSRPASVTACDVDGDGLVDLFLAGAIEGDRPNAVLLRRGEGFALDRDHPLAAVEGVRAAAWADYDDDGLVDVYLCRRGPNQLWRQAEKGRWQDVTESAGVAGGDLDTVDGSFFDADHDGDLDLFVVNANGRNELFRHEPGGTFRAVARETGIAGDGRPSKGHVAADLDGDGDVDLVVIHESPPHEVYENDRLQAWRPAAGFDDLRSSGVAAAIAADLDGDGLAEIHTLPPGPSGGATILCGDVEGSGDLSLIGVEGNRGACLAVLDPARGPSLVRVESGEAPRIEDPGPGRHRFLALSFVGNRKEADRMRSNASGIGVHVAVRVGSHWTQTTTYRSSSGPGQSLQPLAVGLRSARRLDYVTLLWPDNLLQTETGLEAGIGHVVDETQRMSSWGE